MPLYFLGVWIMTRPMCKYLKTHSFKTILGFVIPLKSVRLNCNYHLVSGVIRFYLFSNKNDMVAAIKY